MSKKITVDVSDNLHKKVARYAKKNGTTLSDIVRKALAAAIKQ